MIVQKYETLSTFLRALSAEATVKEGSNQNVFVIGKYSGKEGDGPEFGLKQYTLAVTEKYPARWHDGRTLYTKQPGELSLLPGSFIPQMRAQTPFEFLLCLIDPSLLSTVEDELDRRPRGELHPMVNFHDLGLQQLMRLLYADATQGESWEQLYSEHLTHALALRVLSLKGGITSDIKARSPLPHRALQRVIERMNELGDKLTLEELAKESGYSRNHFLRMFQAATGRTPHNYLTHLRLERAQKLLRKQRISLVDVAMDCGFSSHSHMTRAFRTFLGVTPSEYQRHLSGRTLL